MKPSSSKAVSNRQKDFAGSAHYSQFGVALPRSVLRALEKRGIYCQPAVSIEHQHLARRYVLRATESGGAVADMGRYCAYLDLKGDPVTWLQPIDSISGNGRHAIVIAPELVRIEMLRIGHTCELAITQHILVSAEGRARPAIQSALLFRGRQGTLAIELWKQSSNSQRGSVTPVFYTPAGEVMCIPEQFDNAIRKITGAVSCIGCKHAHLSVPPRATNGDR
jgi:hypothetical protein